MEINKHAVIDGALVNCNGHKLKNILEAIKKSDGRGVYYVLTHYEVEDEAYHTRYMFFNLNEVEGLLFCMVEGFSPWRVAVKNLYTNMEYPRINVKPTGGGIMSLLRLTNNYNKITKKKETIELNAHKTGDIDDLTVADFQKIADLFNRFYWVEREEYKEAMSVTEGANNIVMRCNVVERR